MRTNPHSHYTIMFIADDRTMPFTLRIRRNIVRTIASLVALWACVLIFVVLFFGRISVRLHERAMLEKELERVKKENSRLTEALKKAEKLSHIAEYFEHLAKLTIQNDDKPTTPSPLLHQQQFSPFHEEKAAEDTYLALPAEHQVDSDFAAAVPSISPVDGWITKTFSMLSGKEAHAGIDIAAAAGTPVRAPAAGTIVGITTDTYLGLSVEIDHGNGFRTRYGHCQQILVNKGDRVVRGQTIALVGSTGRSTAPHLHYEVYYKGVPHDPEKYILTSPKIP